MKATQVAFILLAAAAPLAAQEVSPTFGERVDVEVVNIDVVVTDASGQRITDLLREEPVKPDHRTPHIQLLGFRAMNRVCGVCFDPSDPTSAPAGFYALARNR